MESLQPYEKSEDREKPLNTGGWKGLGDCWIKSGQLVWDISLLE